MTAPLVGNFLGEMAQAGGLKHSTLATYRSALSTYWEEAGILGAANPTAAPIITRVLDGIKRVQGEEKIAQQKQGAQKARIVEMTPGLLQAIARSLGELSTDPEAQMHWAAATCFVFGLFRPNELLGSPAHPDPIHESQITFYVQNPPAPDRAVHLRPLGDSPYPTPTYYIVQLYQQKAVQPGQQDLHGQLARTIADRGAVQAMWQWMHTRRSFGELEQRLFKLPGRRALSTRQLVDRCAQAVWASLGERVRFTGKSFRRGGASALMAAGASGPDMQAAGGWRSVSMPDRYASDHSKRARMIGATSLMGAAASYAGMESVTR